MLAKVNTGKKLGEVLEKMGVQLIGWEKGKTHRPRETSNIHKIALHACAHTVKQHLRCLERKRHAEKQPLTA